MRYGKIQKTFNISPPLSGWRRIFFDGKVIRRGNGKIIFTHPSFKHHEGWLGFTTNVQFSVEPTGCSKR